MTIFIGRSEAAKESPIEKMRPKFDTLFGRFIYNKRIAIVDRLHKSGVEATTMREPRMLVLGALLAVRDS